MGNNDIKKEHNVQELVDTIKSSSTYRLAEDDSDFIKSCDSTRGVRLELDYLKAEFEMEKMGIEHTVVVFGSARIKERTTAKAYLEEIQKRLKSDSDNDSLIQELHIAERMLEKSIYYDDARRLGKYVASSGKGIEDNRLVIMTGGGPGIMEAANRGAYDVGAKSVGLNIKLPHEQFPNPYITPNLCFQFRYFSMRKLHFFLRAKAIVVYPGGFGTFDELFEFITLIQTKKTNPIPVVLVGHSYWNRAINFDFLVEEGVISIEDSEIFYIANNALEAWKYILNWYINCDNPLFKKDEKSGIEDD